MSAPFLDVLAEAFPSASFAWDASDSPPSLCWVSGPSCIQVAAALGSPVPPVFQDLVNVVFRAPVRLGGVEAVLCRGESLALLFAGLLELGGADPFAAFFDVRTGMGPLWEPYGRLLAGRDISQASLLAGALMADLVASAGLLVHNSLDLERFIYRLPEAESLEALSAARSLVSLA